MEKAKLGLGIDLGGTKIGIGIVDLAGKVKKSVLLETKVKDGADAIVKDIFEATKELLSQEGKGSVCCAGVGMAAQIEKETGVVCFAPNLGWKNFPLQKELGRLLDLPVWVINDVRAATWGEWLYGAGRNCNDLLCLFIGTGIGGGIVSGGEMLFGDSNTAGEVGHITIDLHGPLCTCGNHGCFEAFAGGWAIARRAKELIATSTAEEKFFMEQIGVKLEEITAKHLIEAYRKDNPLAEKIIEEVKEALVVGVASLVNAFNPKRLILGGGIIKGIPELIEVVRKELPKRALKAPLISLEIAPAELKNDAGLIGAAAYAMRLVHC